MGKASNPPDGSVGETKLRNGVENVDAHEDANLADTDIRLDNEKDTLYEDGLEVEDDSEQLAGTRATDHRS